MNTRMIVAILVGAFASFLLGWVVFGIIMQPYYESNQVHYPGLMRGMDMRMWGIFLAQLCWAIMLTWIFDRWANIRTFGSGFTGGLIIGLLMYAGFDLFMWSMMNIYSYKFLIVDVLANGIFFGVIGGIIAMVLGYGNRMTRKA